MLDAIKAEQINVQRMEKYRLREAGSAAVGATSISITRVAAGAEHLRTENADIIELDLLRLNHDEYHPHHVASSGTASPLARKVCALVPHVLLLARSGGQLVTCSRNSVASTKSGPSTWRWDLSKPKSPHVCLRRHKSVDLNRHASLTCRVVRWGIYQA